MRIIIVLGVFKPIVEKDLEYKAQEDVSRVLGVMASCSRLGFRV